VVVAFEVTVLP